MKHSCLLLFLLSQVAFGQESLKSIMAKHHLNSSDLIIHIDKSERKMTIMADTLELTSYDCVLGFNPIDDKKQEGDGCTPEGTFKIRSMYPHKSWDYFIWIDYPNQESWKRFNQRKRDGTIGSNAAIGGEIGIHGVPDKLDSLIDNKVDWTLGCISLREADIKELYQAISKETTIQIQP